MSIRRERVRSRLISAVVFSIFVSWGGSDARAEYCDEATAVEGLRACDDQYADGCSSCYSSITGVHGTWEADYSSFREAEGYLDDLDADIDGIEGNYMEIIDLGFVPGMEIPIDDTATYDGTAAQLLASGVMTVVRLTEDADLPIESDEKPAILLVCGIHAHEWLPQEVCLGYVDWLVKAANEFGYAAPDSDYARDLLGRREIWAVVMADPAGRLYDERLSDFVYGSGEAPSPNDWRKNRQWDEHFVCEPGPVNVRGAGRCDATTGWLEDGDYDAWNLPGVNVGSSFSHGWGTTESVRFGR